jgi:hypothetical protein
VDDRKRNPGTAQLAGHDGAGINVTSNHRPEAVVQVLTVPAPDATSDHACRGDLLALIRYWSAAGASPAALALLTFLWADDRPDEYQSTRWLADELGVSSSTVQRATSEAARLGLLAVENRGPRSKTWRRIIPPMAPPVDICSICAVGGTDEPGGICTVCAAGGTDRTPSVPPAARSTTYVGDVNRVPRWVVDDDGNAWEVAS